MNRTTEVHIIVWRATPAIQCALRLFDSFTCETTKINYQFLNNYFIIMIIAKHEETALAINLNVLSFINFLFQYALTFP